MPCAEPGRRLVVSLVVASLWLGSLAAVAAQTPAAPQGFQALSDEVTRIDVVDAQGDQVAWATPVGNDVEIRLTDLSTGSERALTTIPGDEDGVSLGNLAFDGRWVVWSDDRFGDAEVLAVDTESGKLSRISDHPAQDVSVDVDQGTAVWTRAEKLMIAELATGEVSTFRSAVGAKPEPTIQDGLVAWSQSAGAQPTIALASLGGGNVTQAPRDPGTTQHRPRLAGGQLVWTTLVINEGREFEGAVLQMTAVTRDDGVPELGAVVNLTGPPSSVKDPTLGDGWVSWLQREDQGSTFLVVQRLDGEASFQVPGPVSQGRFSEEHLLVVGAEEQAGPLWVTQLAQAPGQAEQEPGIAWPLAIAGIVLLGAGLAWNRLFGKDE